MFLDYNDGEFLFFENPWFFRIIVIILELKSKETSYLSYLSLYSEEELVARLRKRQMIVNTLKTKRDAKKLTPEEADLLAFYSLEIREIKKIIGDSVWMRMN